MQYPPRHNNSNVKKSIVSAPSKYPATEEKTTLTDNRILVISVKFLRREVVEETDPVVVKFMNLKKPRLVSLMIAAAKIHHLPFFYNIYPIYLA